MTGVSDSDTSIESQLAAAQLETMRTRVAARHGIRLDSTEPGKPSDAEMFLTGADEETLTLQAQRLAARAREQLVRGNIAPKEGNSPSVTYSNDPMREFVAELFDRD